ncbi:MAG: biotin/lipoyl-containing protein [Eubacteriales bacterium]|jgi:biotin carboxyl carrier protein|nr:acetyl-CoA carboxylase biotin carboxyl carrier protein subunit [Clostridium sp.]MCI6214352.1 acetyl-CoA carboxylase biotin carboxyl carrier protein subunit [Clostridiales bacterium]MDY2683502.1 biotin/lipoyl-containing protein [Eubacteriales bacterium]MCI6954620.1 acetyl-CoA carboxylase biotin carboxyl carrier protein subunit [Clostridiales bacterium]MCI7201832.1 acetyl-CoA carboxylase biotin carboxyl carrier protein subunit [Clostridiales bacterium]
MRKFNIKVNGQAYEVEVEEVAGGFAPAPVVPVAAAPAPAVAPVAAPAPEKAEAKAAPAPAPVAAPAGGTQLKAPMPGTVIDFKATNGAAVKKGQTVLILEAMKMENEIVAPVDGVITFVASKGASVNTDDLLAVIA